MSTELPYLTKSILALLIILALVIPPMLTFAQSASNDDQALIAQQALTAQIDQMLTDTFVADKPGAAVIVVRDGEVLLRKGYGMADLELGVPVAPEMIFRLASITKQFTAVAILMLVDAGKVTGLILYQDGVAMLGQRVK